MMAMLCCICWMAGEFLAVAGLGVLEGVAEAGDGVLPVVDGVAVDVGGLGGGGFGGPLGDSVEDGLLRGGEGWCLHRFTSQELYGRDGAG